MKIEWEKKPQTPEQQRLVNYLTDHMDIVFDLVELSYRHNMYSIALTPKSFKNSFFTFEFKKHPSSDFVLILIWKGIRVGDALPILHGHLNPKAI